MSSSTSSSKLGTIPISLVVALLVIGGYEAVLRSGKVQPGEGLGPLQTNVCTLEKYFYATPETPWCVAVGSSLTANLKDRLGPRFFNLGTAGGCAVTGLAAIEDSPATPKVVLVEISSTLTRGRDDALLAGFESPITSSFVSRIHALQQRSQPFNVAASAYKRRKGYVEGGTTYQSPELRAAAIQGAIEQRTQPYTQQELDELARSFEAARRQIGALESRGIKVFLYEIPMEPAVDQAPRERRFEQLAFEAFPKSQYAWLPDYHGPNWRTNDGIHLVPEDAARFCDVIVQELGQ